jgi:fructose-bisphosphate aldolase class 1
MPNMNHHQNCDYNMSIEDTLSEEIIAISYFMRTLYAKTVHRQAFDTIAMCHNALIYLKIHTGAITEYNLINETRKKITQARSKQNATEANW